MRNTDIQWAALQVFQECAVFSFPINCFHIAQQYKFKLIKYSSLPEAKRLACLILSEDACLIGNSLFYNDQMSDHRIRFSIAHELGHYILGSVDETDANQFASYLLAPRMAILYAKCMNRSDVSRVFNISEEAADYAFQDYHRWRKREVYRMSSLDRNMYAHFYNKEAKKFVYSITYCHDCNEILYNLPGVQQCDWCGKRYMNYLRDVFINDAIGM